MRDIKDGVMSLPHSDARALILKVEEKRKVVMEVCDGGKFFLRAHFPFSHQTFVSFFKAVEKRGLLLNKFPIDKLEHKKMTLDLDQWMFEIAMCLSKNVK